MRCFVCDGRVIHGGDHDDDDRGAIVSNLHCDDCGRFYLMYSPEDDYEQDAEE